MTASPAPRQGMSSRLATGARDDWESPADVIDRVRQVGPIVLDPCTSEANPTGARAHWFPPTHDGLGSSPWLSDDGVCYVNPPYGQMKTWAARIAAEAARGCQIVSLVAARPDARWFFQMGWDTAQAICFWRGRLRFVGAPSSAPFPSALIYHGPRPWAFEAAFSDAGKVVRL